MCSSDLNLAPGVSNNPIEGTVGSCGIQGAGAALGTEGRYFDPCAFTLPTAGTYGNLGRNTIIGPGRTSVNLSLVKNFKIREGHTLTYRMEWFNLFNRTNFGLPNRTVFSGTTYAGNAGVLQELSSSARQMQFNLRYSF